MNRYFVIFFIIISSGSLPVISIASDGSLRPSDILKEGDEPAPAAPDVTAEPAQPVESSQPATPLTEPLTAAPENTPTVGATPPQPITEVPKDKISYIGPLINWLKEFIAEIIAKINKPKTSPAAAPAAKPEAETAAEPIAGPPQKMVDSLPPTGQEPAAPNIEPAITTTPPAATGSPFADTITPSPKETFSGDNFEFLSRKGEMMFSEDDLQKIYASLNGVSVKGDNKVEISVESASLAPTFFVRSVLYFSPVNWSVLINNRKYTPFYNKNYNGRGEIDLEVLNVKEDSVTIAWTTHNLDTIAKNWRQKLTYIDPENNPDIKSPGYVTTDKKIFVDSAGGRVIVTLEPGQTFVSHDMNIAEGYKAPAAIVVPVSTKADSQDLTIKPKDQPITPLK